MLDTISISRLSSTHPELRRRMEQIAQIANSQDIFFRITMTMRSYNEQAALYAQGRRDLAQVNAMRAAVNWLNLAGQSENNIVTNAPPGYSWHDWALAADFVPMDGVNPVWDNADLRWAKIIGIAESCGLASGSTWTTPDFPHLQPQELPVTPTDEDRQDFADAGMTAAWKKYFPTPV